jgi:hypothetical protein
MGDYGIKIAKDGYGITDGDNRLILNTKYPFLKMMAAGVGQLTCTSGVGNVTIYTHNLGYKPMFYVYTYSVNVNDGSFVEAFRLCSWRDYYGLGIWAKYYAYVTTTTLVLDINTAWGATETLNYAWVVFYDPLA